MNVHVAGTRLILFLALLTGCTGKGASEVATGPDPLECTTPLPLPVAEPAVPGRLGHAHGVNGVSAIVVTGDGAVLINAGLVGDFRTPGVARLGPTGAADRSFAQVRPSSILWFSGVLAAAKDGPSDIYLFTPSPDFTTYRLIRLNCDGTIDTGFSSGSGFLPSDSNAMALTPAKDGSGRLYVGGTFTSYNGHTANRIVRLNVDGSVDTSFVTGRGFNYEVDAIAAARDGSGDIYVGGFYGGYNGTASRSIIRLNSSGSVDKAFVVGSGFDDTVRTIAPATDGSGDVYVGGAFYSYQGVASPGIIRLNPDGSIDTAFSVGTGFPQPGDPGNPDGDVWVIVPADDGSGDIYAGGLFESYNGVPSLGIARLHSDGSMDTGFHTGTGFNGGSPTGNVHAIATTRDGTGGVYVGGIFHRYDSHVVNGLVRLNADGSVATDFETSGHLYGVALALASAPTRPGNILVGGAFTYYGDQASNGIIELQPDGTPASGLVTGAGFGDRFNVHAISPAAPGSTDFYAGGYFDRYDGTPSINIVRLHADGSIDTTFDTGSGFFDVGGEVRKIMQAPDASGDIYVVGGFTTYKDSSVSQIVRLHADGSLDDRFKTGAGFGPQFDRVNAIAAAPGIAGQIYVGGDFREYNGISSPGIIRLNADGSVDPTFNVGTGFEAAALVHGSVFTIMPATDGSGDVYVGGDIDRYNGTSSPGIIRLNSDGSIDAGFAVGIGFIDFPNATIYTISPVPDRPGEIYVGGLFFSYQYLSRGGIVRLRADGSLDASFDTGEGFHEIVFSVLPAQDGTDDVYLGGAGSTYRDSIVNGIVRVRSDGSSY